MKGVVFLGNRNLGFADVPDPTPDVGGVVVELKASGMCGSDLHPYRQTSTFASSTDKLIIAGHEPCGIVAAVGAGVPAHVARIGDRVMVHHYSGCTICRHCRTGWPQLCDPITRITYSANAHGAHAPFMKVPASTLIPLHENLSFEAGAAISCGTGTAWGGLERLRLTGNETIAIFGQGPVGLSATMLASARGCRVIAIDLDDERLKYAKAFGADEIVNPKDGDVEDAIRALTNGYGVESVLETSGSSHAAQAGLNASAVWGKLCLVGIGSQLSLDTKAYLDRQVTVMTSYTMSTVGQTECSDFVVSRNLDLDSLFTHRWRLDQAVDAYRVFDAQSSGKGVFLF
jgi:threonine dehydrogenase-like Zn-dependent dehydrogenase